MTSMTTSRDVQGSNVGWNPSTPNSFAPTTYQYYPTPSDFRWVCLFTASLGGFWAVTLAIEDLTGPSAPPRQRPVQPTTESESPFAPPPPPGAGPSS